VNGADRSNVTPHLAAGPPNQLIHRAHRVPAAGTRGPRWVLILGTCAAITYLTCSFSLERVTGIEPALSAWETNRSGPLTALTWAPDAPLVTVMNPATPGLMANGPWHSAPALCAPVSPVSYTKPAVNSRAATHVPAGRTVSLGSLIRDPRLTC
jgi:hypothetical protein